MEQETILISNHLIYKVPRGIFRTKEYNVVFGKVDSVSKDCDKFFIRFFKDEDRKECVNALSVDFRAHQFCGVEVNFTSQKHLFGHTTFRTTICILFTGKRNIELRVNEEINPMLTLKLVNNWRKKLQHELKYYCYWNVYIRARDDLDWDQGYGHLHLTEKTLAVVSIDKHPVTLGCWSLTDAVDCNFPSYNNIAIKFKTLDKPLVFETDEAKEIATKLKEIVPGLIDKKAVDNDMPSPPNKPVNREGRISVRRRRHNSPQPTHTNMAKTGNEVHSGGFLNVPSILIAPVPLSPRSQRHHGTDDDLVKLPDQPISGSGGANGSWKSEVALRPQNRVIKPCEQPSPTSPHIRPRNIVIGNEPPQRPPKSPNLNAKMAPNEPPVEPCTPFPLPPRLINHPLPPKGLPPFKPSPQTNSKNEPPVPSPRIRNKNSSGSNNLDYVPHIFFPELKEEVPMIMSKSLDNLTKVGKCERQLEPGTLSEETFTADEAMTSEGRQTVHKRDTTAATNDSYDISEILTHLAPNNRSFRVSTMYYVNFLSGHEYVDLPPPLPQRDKASGPVAQQEYSSAMNICHTLNNVLRMDAPSPDTLRLSPSTRQNVCLHLYINNLGTKDWRDLADIIGLEYQAVELIEAFTAHHNQETAAEIVLRHWQFRYNRYGQNPFKCREKCKKEDLVCILKSMHRHDIVCLIEQQNKF